MAYFLFIIACLTSILNSQRLLPKWSATYQMNLSTIVMACNYSGPFSESTLKKISKFGIVDIDWSNNREYWANQKPMTCQQTLITQAQAIKKYNPKTKLFVYRNLVKALPWFIDIRTKILDPLYSNWFLKFKSNAKSYHVQSCTNTTFSNKCSMLYHDQEHQTPEYPSICHQDCDCGSTRSTTVPCG